MSMIFCNNCGQRGHAFRECKDPILSCGIILVRDRTAPNKVLKLPVNVDDIELLMIRRKDSMSYTEFMRGKYDPYDLEYVRRLLENMTQQEVCRLRKESFESSWVRMWNNADKHEHEMRTAREKYEVVKITGMLDRVTPLHDEPEWGFPKGRRLKCENDEDCAEREFFEETNIPRNAYVVVTGIQFDETFYGTNNILYRHKYSLAILTTPQLLDIHKKFTTMQKREISAIGWKTVADCADLTRPHYTGRKPMLQQLAQLMETIEVRLPRE
jgi:8-oxo-dGTP pyrophosphatase MutT (NUDIX family)